MSLIDFLKLFDLYYFRVYLHCDNSNIYYNYSKEYLLSSKYSKWKVKKIISFWENYCNEKVIEILIVDE